MAAIDTQTHSSRTAIFRKLITTAAYYAAFIGLGLGVAAIGPTLPDLARHTRSHLDEISFLFTAHSTGYLLGCLLAGHIYDRVRGHPVMVLMLIAMAATMFLVPLTSLLWLLTLVIFLLGLAGSILDVGGNTLLVWIHQDKVGPYMNGLHAFFGVGTVIAPVVIALLVQLSGDILWAYWALAFYLLPIAVWLARLPSPTHVQNQNNAPARISDYPLVALIVLLFILYVGSEFAMGGWLYSYAVAMKLADTVSAAYLTSVFWGAFTFARLLGVPISLRVRPRYILLGDFATAILGVALILIWSNSSLALWVGSILTGLGMASIIPVILSLAERRMVITGRVTSFFFAGGSVGGMILPWLIGQFFESLGPPVAMWGILLSLIAATLVLLAILKTTRVRMTSSQAALPDAIVQAPISYKH
ncbi:MAG: MFS transporter [Anaerolineae bacterium]|nr:MFS transporter [Anaerolineae bacterium]MDW8072128.1 MFS transporter [Anaerolineae bacterium]